MRILLAEDEKRMAAALDRRRGFCMVPADHRSMARNRERHFFADHDVAVSGFVSRGRNHGYRCGDIS